MLVNCTKNEFYIKDDEFCIENDEFCIKNDEFDIVVLQATKLYKEIVGLDAADV